MRPLVALAAACVVAGSTAAAPPPASAATMVLTEDGMNNLPEMFAEGIVGLAVKKANTEMHTELRGKVDEMMGSLCIKGTSVVDCAKGGTKVCTGGSSDLCHIPPNMLFDVTLEDLKGAMGLSGTDFFGLQSYHPPSVKFSLEPCHEGPLKCLLSGEVGTVKMVRSQSNQSLLVVRGSILTDRVWLQVAQIELGAQIVVRGDG